MVRTVSHEVDTVSPSVLLFRLRYIVDQRIIVSHRRWASLPHEEAISPPPQPEFGLLEFLGCI